MKKIFMSALILCLFNNINSMEEQDSKNILEVLPPELICDITKLIYGDNINNWNDIFSFKKESLKAELDRLRLISKGFNVFEKEELKKFITRLKNARFAWLGEIIKKQYEKLSTEQLNQSLTDFLNKSFLEKDDLETALKLVIAGANVHILDKYGSTVLMNVANYGHTEIVRLLINCGADVNIQNNNGRTALMGAAQYCRARTVRQLINSGAIVNIRDNEGWTALMFATMVDHTEIVGILINSGADVNIQDNNGSTALMNAVGNGYTEIVRLLINSGVGVNIRNKDGRTALIIAAMDDHNHTEIARLLINSGADVNIQNNNGRTALMWADKKGHTEIVELLKDKAKS